MIAEKMPAQMSTVGGALLSIVITVDLSDITKSIMLGAIGTTVSYCISRLLKALFERPPKNSKPDSAQDTK